MTLSPAKIWSSLPTHARTAIFLVACLSVVFDVYEVTAVLARKVAPAAPAENETQLLEISNTEISKGDTSKKQVIFTFDAGGGASSADQILNVLAKHRVTGTFFMTGKFVEANPDLVRRIVAAGHEVFNHTYDHKDLTTLSDADISDELQKMDMALQKVAHITSSPYFRPPYGARDSRVINAAFDTGYQPIYWTVDARDWMEPNITADEVKNRILSNVAPGTIYLMHVGDTITGAILDEVFSTIESRGYKIVSLRQGM